jgi:hypothetical protein
MMSGRAEAGDHVADLGRGHRGEVVITADTLRVQQRAPARRPGLERGDERVRPARDQLRIALAAPIGVAETAVGAGRGVGPQPRRHIHRQPDPALTLTRDRQPGHRPPQPGDIESASCQRVIHTAVTTAMLGHQRQPDQRGHRPVRAQHRLTQLEQRICPRARASVELLPERRQVPDRTLAARVVHTVHRNPWFMRFVL